MLKFFVNPGLLVIADCIYHTSFWIAHKVDCTQMSKNMFVQLSTDMWFHKGAKCGCFVLTIEGLSTGQSALCPILEIFFYMKSECCTFLEIILYTEIVVFR